MRTLYLTLKSDPFKVMATGEKKLEFRSPSKWILSRLENKKYDVVKFTNGYGSDKPYFIAEYKGYYQSKATVYRYSNGLKVVVNKLDYAIVLGKVLEVGNLNED